MSLSEALLESMSMIDEKYLAQSENEKRNVFARRPILSFAAVCVLLMAAVILPQSLRKGISSDNILPQTAESAVEEEIMTDGIPAEAAGVLYDQQLIDYLAAVEDDDVVKIRIETIYAEETDVIVNEEMKHSEAASYMEDEPGEVTEMTKREILSFEAEEGVTMIFHLYSEDGME